MVADPADVAECGDGGRGIRKQRTLVVRVDPGLGHGARAVVRTNFGLIGLDDEIERGGVDVAFFGQDGFERTHPKLYVGEF